MALKTCPDCKKQISTTAQECPHCGRELAFWNHPLKFIVIALICVALAIAGVAILHHFQ
jgi:hypothetical protein